MALGATGYAAGVASFAAASSFTAAARSSKDTRSFFTFSFFTFTPTPSFLHATFSFLSALSSSALTSAAGRFMDTAATAGDATADADADDFPRMRRLAAVSSALRTFRAFKEAIAACA